MTRAAVYLRVSTEEQARHGYSLAAQREACRERARQLGAAEILEFADEGVSGALLERPGLSALREALRGREIQLVVVMDPDRLARNLSHQLLITEEIEKARARLEFINFEWRNTPEGQLFYAVRGAIAQFEKEKIRERTTRGRRQKAKAGRLPLAFRPYGYDYDRSASMLVVNQREAELVRRMFDWLLTEGEGPNGIARRLNALGIPARKGGQWHRNVVRQILRNPVYTGVFWANRYDTAGLGLNRHRPREERVVPTLRPEEEWIPIPVPAIIDRGQWEQAQRVLDRARRLWSGRPRAEYLLSGLVVCARCGLSMTGQQVKEWGRRRRVYTCRRSSQGSRPGACGLRVDASAVEELVWGQVAGWLHDPEELWRAAAWPNGSGAMEQELGEVRQGLQRVRQGRENLIRALEQGAADPEALIEALGRVQEREAALRARERELEERARICAVDGAGRPRAWVEIVQRWWANPDLEFSERRRLVRLLVTRVEAGHSRLRVFVRWPGLEKQSTWGQADGGLD